jgi:hypothetical protein
MEAGVSEPVERAPHAQPATVQHVRVDHRRADVRVPQQLLHRPDVIAGLQKLRRERVSTMSLPT